MIFIRLKFQLHFPTNMSQNPFTDFFRMHVKTHTKPKIMVGNPPTEDYTKEEFRYIDDIGLMIHERQAIMDITNITSVVFGKNNDTTEFTEVIACTQGLEQPSKTSEIDGGLSHKVPLKKRCQILLDYNNFVTSLIHSNVIAKTADIPKAVPKVRHQIFEIPEQDTCCIVRHVDYGLTVIKSEEDNN